VEGDRRACRGEALNAASLEDFIRANTASLAVPLVPEITLHLASESVPLWQKTEEELGEIGLPPPFWAFAWAGGQALARYLLDRPARLAGKRVFDLASGSGLVAIAAAHCGARAVVANDIDPFALAAIRMNAALNQVSIETDGENYLGGRTLGRFDIVLAADICYERDTAERAFAFLRQMHERGAQVLIGDPGRSYFPQQALTALAEYPVPVTRDLEDAEIKRTRVWALSP
jgi:predicted nicotinamide N-methyase